MNLVPQDSFTDKPKTENCQNSIHFGELSLSEFRSVFNTIHPDKPGCLPDLKLDETNDGQGLNRFLKDGSFTTIKRTDIPKPQKEYPDYGKNDADDKQCRREKLPGERFTDWMRLNHYPRIPMCREPEKLDPSNIFKSLKEKLNGIRHVPDPQLRW